MHFHQFIVMMDQYKWVVIFSAHESTSAKNVEVMVVAMATPGLGLMGL